MGARRLLVILALVAAPAAADWLVTTDGMPVETLGPWEVKGRMVVFRSPQGSLSSMRLADVDLEESRRVTRESAEAAEHAAEAPVAEEKAPRKPVLVLTDSDVGHLDQEELEAEAAATGEEAEAAQGGETGTRLSVTEWQEADNSGSSGVTLVGQVRNISEETLMGAGLVVRLLDDDGSVLASADATLSARQLPPRASASFRADFPDVFSYTRVEFESVGLALRTRNADEEPADVSPLDEPGATTF